MKNYLRFSIGMFAMSLIVLGCNGDHEYQPVEGEGMIDPNVSEISLLEEQYDVTLFKRDLTLTDEQGENSVVLRIASDKEETLDRYLSNTKFSMNAVYANEYGDIPSHIQSEDLENHETSSATGSNKSFEGIITEIVSENLKEDVLGTRINFETINKESNSSSKTNGYFDIYRYHVSDKWPRICTIRTFGHSVGYMFHTKNRWYNTGFNTGNPAWTGVGMCEYNNPNNCNKRWEQSALGEVSVWVDGPYKVRIQVGYAPYGGDGYSIEFIR